MAARGSGDEMRVLAGHAPHAADGHGHGAAAKTADGAVNPAGHGHGHGHGESSTAGMLATLGLEATAAGGCASGCTHDHHRPSPSPSSSSVAAMHGHGHGGHALDDRAEAAALAPTAPCHDEQPTVHNHTHAATTEGHGHGHDHATAHIDHHHVDGTSDPAPSPTSSPTVTVPATPLVPDLRICDHCVDGMQSPHSIIVDHTAVVHTRLHVRNICCESEVRLIKKILSPLKGIEKVSVNALTRTVIVAHCPIECCLPPEAIVTKLNGAHLGASLVSRVDNEDLFDTTTTRNPIKLMRSNPRVMHCVVIWTLFIAACSLIDSNDTASTILFISATAIGALPVIRSAVNSLRHKILDMNVLMLLAIIGASGSQEWVEASLVTVLFITAELLELVVMGRVERALTTATQMSVVRTATRVSDNKIVPLSELKVGEVISLRPGDSSPIDGVVSAGNASLSEAAVTGEPIPVAKSVGSDICSGSMVLNGYVEVRLSKPADASALAQMAHLVMEAQAQRGRSQKMVDAFAKYWTPAVLVGVFVLCAIMPAVTDDGLMHWVERALVLLVLACPCALVLAAPIPTTCAIAAAAKHGVLLKRCEVVEDLAAVTTVGLDKTGTLTVGDFSVVDVAPIGKQRAQDSASEVLRLAAAVEACSAHPLADAIVKRAIGCHGDNIEAAENALPKVEGFTVVEGMGVAGTISETGTPVLVGNDKTLANLPAHARSAFSRFVAMHPTDTTLAVVVAGELRLAIALNDTVRPEAAAAVQKMQGLGCAIEMLTGDVDRAAQPVSTMLNLDAYHASLLPEDKHRWITDKTAAGSATAMLGDGINDSTALAAATVGVAMGASGSALAARSADVVILTDNLVRLPQTMKLAKMARRTIIFNIVFAAAIKLVAVVAALTGSLKLWMAVLVDVGSLFVVLLVGMHVLGVDVWGNKQRLAQLDAVGPDIDAATDDDEEASAAVTNVTPARLVPLTPDR